MEKTIPLKGQEVQAKIEVPLPSAMQTVIEGKTPSVEQLGAMMSKAKQVLEEHPSTLARDVKTILEDSQQLVEDKNKDGKLQKFLEHSYRVAKEGVSGLQNMETPSASTEPIKDKAMSAVDSIKTLVYQLIRSGEFRGLMIEGIELIRLTMEGIRQDATQQLPAVTSSSESTPTPTSSFTSPFPGPSFSPFNTRAADTQPSSSGIPPLDSFSSLNISTPSTSSPSSTFSPSMPSTTWSTPSSTSTLSPSSSVFGSSIPLSSSSSSFSSSSTSAFGAQPRSFTEALKQDIARDDNSFSSTNELAQQAKEATKLVARKLKDGQYIPEQQRRELTERFKNLLQRLLQDKEFRNATRSIMAIFDYMGYVASHLKKQTEEKMTVDMEELRDLLYEAKDVIEQFTGNMKLDNMTDTAFDLYKSISEDDEARQYFYDLKQFVLETFDHPDQMDGDQWFNTAQELIDRGRGLMDWENQKYKQQFNQIFNQLRDMMNGIMNDRSTQRVAQDVRQLSRDILFNAAGRPSLDKLMGTVQQLKVWLVPMLKTQLENIPLPKLEGTTPKYDYWVDNVVFDGTQIIPDQIFVDFETKTELNVPQLASDKLEAYLRVQIKDLNTHFKNARFWYHRKKTPTIEDSGYLDLELNRLNFTFKWLVESSSNKPWQFTMKKAEFTIGQMVINIKDARHQVLDKLLTSLFNKRIKTNIEEKVNSFMMEKLTTFNAQLEEFANRPAASQ